MTKPKTPNSTTSQRTSVYARLAMVVVCAGYALMGPFGPDVVFAGLSGPGGPTLKYEYMPKLEDFKAQRPDIKETPGQTAQPLSPQADAGAPVQGAPPSDLSPSQPKSGSARPKAQQHVSPPDEYAQRKQILTRLYGYLSNAKDKSQADRLATSIERLWLHSGSPTTDILMKRADSAIETGRWSVAETFADAVVKLQPAFTEGWMRRALILFQRRQPTRALRDLRRVLALEPNHFIALDRVGAILESVGEYKPALEAYRKLKRLHPQAPGVTERIEELTRKVEGEQI